MDSSNSEPRKSDRKLQATLLLAYTDKGKEILETEFNEWYDEEHVPRLFNFPGCSNASRYRAIDAKYPPWAALYCLDSPEILASQEWSELPNQASDNEKFILETIPVVTWSIYTLFHRSCNGFIPASTGAGKVICIVHLQLTRNPEAATSAHEQKKLEVDFIQWYRETAEQGISATPGWVQSKMYLRYHDHSGNDNSQLKTTPELKSTMTSGVLMIHEWDERDDEMEFSKFEANFGGQVGIWEKENLCRVKRDTRILRLHKEW
ncbi:hypothetical protein C8J55DRAFT_515033 [Lentinula edodes]|uniref:Uncharacterized protein n=1 Tax=Lentinula lateritia TaxID=40482 RepID=A0A9W9DP50_9AGAR|nr:hypothetical protein C8J55DRAFT_515033 [Lentinula edodes]